MRGYTSLSGCWYTFLYSRGGAPKKAARPRVNSYYIAFWGPREILASWEMVKEGLLRERYQEFLKRKLAGEILGFSAYCAKKDQLYFCGEVPKVLIGMKVSLALTWLVEGKGK
jgi:hypothetical protein